MSNLAVVNFSVGGTLTISGTTTLGNPLSSSSTASFQGLTTTNLAVSGTSNFNGSLPTSTQTPTLNSQLTTKKYVDDSDDVLNTRITTVDALRKKYVDDSDDVLNTRITSVDALRKKYVDDSDDVLNTRITTVDSARKTYADGLYTTLSTRIDNIRTNFDVFYYVINGNTQSFGSSGGSILLSGVGMQIAKISSPAYDFQNSIYTSTGGTFYFYANATISNERYGYMAIFKNGVMAIQGGVFSYPTIQTTVFATVGGLVATVNGDIITVVFGHIEASQIRGNTVTDFGGYRIK